MQTPEIVAQTDHWLVVNKPSGMVVHRSRGANDRYTLVKTMRDELGPDVFPVNRLDRQTSGIIVMARSRDAARKPIKWNFRLLKLRLLFFLCFSRLGGVNGFQAFLSIDFLCLSLVFLF